MSAHLLPFRSRAQRAQDAVAEIRRAIRWPMRIYRARRFLREHRLWLLIGLLLAVSALQTFAWWLP